MRPILRKLNLTAHVTSSVGWLGAVLAFLVLSVVGLMSHNDQTVRSCYVAMNLIGGFIIVPLSIVSLLSGLVQSLGTHWGLTRHYWVFTKFSLTVGATLLLLMHQFTAVAGAARRATDAAGPSLPDMGRLATQLVFDAGLATLVLLITTTLSVFKPWGRIQWARNERESIASGTQGAVARAPLGPKIAFAAVGLFLTVIIVLHLFGKGLGGPMGHMR